MFFHFLGFLFSHENASFCDYILLSISQEEAIVEILRYTISFPWQIFFYSTLQFSLADREKGFWANLFAQKASLPACKANSLTLPHEQNRKQRFLLRQAS